MASEKIKQLFKTRKWITPTKGEIVSDNASGFYDIGTFVFPVGYLGLSRDSTTSDVILTVPKTISFAQPLLFIKTDGTKTVVATYESNGEIKSGETMPQGYYRLYGFIYTG